MLLIELLKRALAWKSIYLQYFTLSYTEGFLEDPSKQKTLLRQLVD